MGFTASVADPGLIILSKGGTSTYLLFYVDDMLVVGPDRQQIWRVKQLLAQEFEIQDLGKGQLLPRHGDHAEQGQQGSAPESEEVHATAGQQVQV